MIIIVNLLNVTTQSYNNVIDYISYAVQLYLYDLYLIPGSLQPLILFTYFTYPLTPLYSSNH